MNSLAESSTSISGKITVHNQHTLSSSFGMVTHPEEANILLIEGQQSGGDRRGVGLKVALQEIQQTGKLHNIKAILIARTDTETPEDIIAVKNLHQNFKSQYLPAPPLDALQRNNITTIFVLYHCLQILELKHLTAWQWLPFLPLQIKAEGDKHLWANIDRGPIIAEVNMEFSMVRAAKLYALRGIDCTDRDLVVGIQLPTKGIKEEWKTDEWATATHIQSLQIALTEKVLRGEKPKSLEIIMTGSKDPAVEKWATEFKDRHWPDTNLQITPVSKDKFAAYMTARADIARSGIADAMQSALQGVANAQAKDLVKKATPSRGLRAQTLEDVNDKKNESNKSWAEKMQSTTAKGSKEL